MKFQHSPAPWPVEEPDPQPELRAGFEALGFRVIGAAMRIVPTQAQFERLAAGYADGDRQRFLEWGGRPYQVLAAPDGTAFVRLAWFWAGRYAEVSTVLPDGRLVTTSTDWGIDPAGRARSGVGTPARPIGIASNGCGRRRAARRGSWTVPQPSCGSLTVLTWTR